MPHKPATNRNVTVQFVSVSLTVDLKHDLANWAADNRPRLVEILADVVQNGYRVSIKSEEQGYSASMAAIRDQLPNKGLILVERGGTPERTLLRLLWAHHSHFKGVWPRDAAVEGDDW